jgi:uncharacterized membrane protein
MTTISSILVLLAILGTGLIAGTFFVFSVAIMSALRKLPPNKAMAAMQSINVVIQNSIFLGVFMGTAVVSLVLGITAVMDRTTPGSYYLLAGAALYVIGSFSLTIVFNVPLNNRLDAADPTTASGHDVWSNYLTNWTNWNHVRTVASILSTAAFALAFAKN